MSETTHADAIRILRCLTDENARPITLHIGYITQLGAAADALQSLAAARAEFEALQADLAAVRTVEAWPDETKGRDVVWDDGYWWARHEEDAEMLPLARERTITALGRALAAQEESHG